MQCHCYLRSDIVTHAVSLLLT